MSRNPCNIGINIIQSSRSSESVADYRARTSPSSLKGGNTLLFSPFDARESLKNYLSRTSKRAW